MGLKQTSQRLEKSAMKYFGTRHEPTGSLTTAIDVGNFRVAWAACTNYVNVVADGCDRRLYSMCDESFFASIRKLKGTSGIHGVVTAIHAGQEGSTQPVKDAEQLMKRAAEAGSFLVLGNHPHVPQKLETVQRPDGATSLVVYSLGNFASGHINDKMRTSGMLFFHVGYRKGELQVLFYQHQPLTMTPDYHLRAINPSCKSDPELAHATSLSHVWGHEQMMSDPKPQACPRSESGPKLGERRVQQHTHTHTHTRAHTYTHAEKPRDTHLWPTWPFSMR